MGDKLNDCVTAMRRFWQPDNGWISMLEVCQEYPRIKENALRRVLRNVQRKKVVPVIGFPCSRHLHFVRVVFLQSQVVTQLGWHEPRPCSVCCAIFTPQRSQQIRCDKHKKRDMSTLLEKPLPSLLQNVDDWARLFYSLSLYRRRGIVAADWPSLAVATGLSQRTLLNTAVVDYENHASSLGIDRLRQQCASVGLAEMCLRE